MMERFKVERDLPELGSKTNLVDIVDWQLDAFKVLVKEFFDLVEKTNEVIDRINQHDGPEA